MARAAVYGAQAAPPAMTSAVGVSLIAVHGGAGASTMATLLNDGSGFVVEWRPGMPRQADRLAVLVARSTAQGLTAAADWVARWRADLPRPALMVVADVPFREPPIVRYRLRALSSQVNAVVKVPYLYPLRHLDDPVDALTNRRVAVAVKAVRLHLAHICTPASGGS